MNILKKTFISVLIIAMVGVSFVPRKSYAIFGVGDIVSDFGVIPQEVAQTIGQVTQIVNMVQGTLKEFGLDVVIYKLAQQASQKLIAKVLNHTNGGANIGDGVEELFVKNFGQHFQNINDKEFSKFTDMLAQDTSNPFSKMISQGLVSSHANIKNPLSSFNLDKIDGVDWQQASTDLETAGSKGWDFYTALGNPANTPIGSTLIAQDQLASQIKAKVETAKVELTSTGFKPDKGKCSSSPDGDLSNYHEENGAWVPNSTSTKDCGSAEIKTPSSTNDQQTGQATKESFERLRNSDELGKILMNTITQLAQGLIKKGLSSLQSDGGGGGKIYGGPQDVSKILNTPGSSWINSPQQVVDLHADLESAMQKTQLEISYITQLADVVKAPIVGKVTVDGIEKEHIALDLEMCIPGPDTNYEQRLQEYVAVQAKDTQMRASKDGDKGTNNSNAATIIGRLTQQATQEQKVILENPLLNIPGASDMRGSLREFYKLSKSFSGLIDTIIIKQQTYNALAVIKAQVMIYGNGLILFTNQWDALDAAAKQQLYTSLGFTPIVDDPLTPDVDEGSPDNKETEMKNRVLANQWDQWETNAPEDKKSELYRQFIGLGRDISDSDTVENSKLKLQSAKTQIEDLGHILNDCLIIRQYVATGGTTPVNQAIIDSLTSDRIKNVVKLNGPSILTATQADIDLANQRIVQSTEDLPGITGANLGTFGDAWKNMDAANKLQQDLPNTPVELINQDEKGRAFCRLTMYHIIYWAPSPTGAELTGRPIGCSNSVVIPRGNSATMTESDKVEAFTSAGDALLGTTKTFDANWYHTNAAELLYNLNE